MKDNLMLFLLSPYRGKNYDFNALILPKNADLLIISDEVTLNNYVPKKFSSLAVGLVPYKHIGYSFLCLDSIEKVIVKYLRSYSNIIIHSEEELFLEEIAKLTDKYRLIGSSGFEIEKYRNKYTMKNVFTQQPHFFKIPRYTDKIISANNFQYPVIIKPVASAGAIDVHRIESWQALNQHIKTTGIKDYIIEEFIDGELYHCDALASRTTTCFFLCGRYFDPLEHAVKNKSYVGSQIVTDGTIYQRLLHATEELIRYFNAYDAVIHAEFILTKNDIYFIEIGKRPAGAWVSQMYQIAHDVNIFNQHLYSSYPEPLKEVSLANRYKYCCGLYLMRQDNAPIESIYIPDISCKHHINNFTKNWSQTKKINSVVDSIAEIYLYSNDQKAYLNSLQTLLNHHQILTKSAAA